MNKQEMIKLAKECGSHMAVDAEGNPVPICYNDPLIKYTNAIIEMCAEKCYPYTSGQYFAKSIRELKVSTS